MGNDKILKTWKEKAMDSLATYRTNCGYSWDTMAEKINTAIKELKSNGIVINLNTNTEKDRKAWQLVIDKGEASRFNEDHYKDLYKVYEYLTIPQNSLTNNVKKTTTLKETHNEPFTYCTTKFQDTILPYLYKHFYTKEFSKLNFEINKDWNEILDAFKTKDVQIALHNYSTALAITRSVKGNPAMFFFPFFLFKGYGIVVKRSSMESFCKKHDIKNNGFNRLSPDFKKIFLEDSTVTLEPKTDVEWVYKNYCAKYEADWNKVREKIKPFDVNEGKQKFVLKNGTDIYCTNTIHLVDLGKQPDKYEIIKNDDVTKHKNVNGLLCTMDFFNNNSVIVKALIATWYHHIIEFIKEKEEILHNSIIGHFDYAHLKALNKSLNDFTKSNLTLQELMVSFKTNNEFFTDSTTAFNEFYTTDFIEKQTTNKSFWEIASVQLGKEDEDNMEEIISELHSNMKEAFTKINNG